MNRLFNRASACLAAALAFALPASAVTPVAVWDGGSADYNFTQLTRGEYTLAQIGQGYSTQAAADGSYLQIGESNTEAAFTLKKSDGSNMGASTVIIKFENMPANGGSNRALLSFLKNGTFNNVSDIPYPFIGVAEEKNLSWASSFIWDNGIWNSASNVRTPNAFSDGQHTAALAYSYAAGSAFYVDGVLRGSSSGLRSSGYSPLGVAIGGVADSRTSNKFYAMTGMKVTAIAFFEDKISDADVASYVFPSDADKLWTATVSANTAWADIAWDGNKTWQADMSEAKVQLTIESGATVTAPASLTVDNLIVSGAGTLTFATGENTVSASGAISAAVTLPANATLKTSGVLRFDSSSNAFAGNSLFEVVSGTAYLNAAECGLSGDITVDAGATLVNLRSSDALNYNASPVTTVRVYGTLDFGSTRWSTRGVARNCYYFYDGAVIKGVGDSNGALDFIEGSTGGAINLEGAVALSATIKTRDDLSNIALTVAEGKTATLNLTSSVIGTGKSFSKAGAGTLKFANNPTFDAGLKVTAGALDFTGVSEVTTKVIYTAAPSSGIDYLKASNWKGTFVADWAGANNALFDINSYGNANSVVEVTKLAGGYVSGSNANITVVPTVKVSGTMLLDNGYSGKITTLTKVTGSGVFSNKTYSVDITTLDNFTGTLVPLIDSQYVGMKIGTINLSTTPANESKIVNLGEGSNIGQIENTKVSVNGVVDDTIKLEVKSDGIYVAPLPSSVTITVPAIDNTSVTVTADGNAVEPTTEGANTYEVPYGAAVEVKYTSADDDLYEVSGGTIELTPTADQTVETSGVTVTLYKAVYDGTKYTSVNLALGYAYNGRPASFGKVITVLDSEYVDDGTFDEFVTWDPVARTYTVIAYPARIAATYYATLGAAVKAAVSGDVVVLLDDVSLDAAVTNAAGKSITVNLNGKTVTGPADGYAFSNAGTVAITGSGTVTGAGGIAANTASGASISIANGTYSATGDLFANVEGGTIAVSGGTYNKTVDGEYLVEGYEVKDNGNGTYGIQEDKGWIFENAAYAGHTGSWETPLAYDETTGKARIEGGNTYTADAPSAGRFVTLNMTFGFDAINEEDDDCDDAKAAVRLGAGETDGTFVFQLYTSENGVSKWVDVSATGVTATTNVDYTFTFVLDMTNRTYTASVGEAALAADGAATFAFAGARATDAVQSIEFTGAGSFTSLTGSYEDGAVEFVADQVIGSVTLTAAQADWLNAQSNYDALAAKLASMTQTALDTAYLLNLDVLSESYDGSYTFAVTKIGFGKDAQENETVVVTVSLTRKGALAGGINGTLKLKGGNALPTSGFETLASVEFSDADFSKGDTTTCTFLKGANAAEFYLPVIE